MLLKRKEDLENGTANTESDSPMRDGSPKQAPAAPVKKPESQIKIQSVSAKQEKTPDNPSGEEVTPTTWLNNVFLESVRLDASDIHIIPEKDYTSVRFRIGGRMSDVAKWDINYHEMVISRIKIISGLSVVEKNIPQDGHLELMFETRPGDTGPSSLNFRVSTMPTINGEAAVLRVLSKETSLMTLDQVGLSEKSLYTFRKILQRGHGVILMTGHSGSGKTTTLYAALNEINAEEKVILTLEDPVEYSVPRIQQSQVNPAVGYNFSNGLRAALRQDPDVIMVGEVRDEETAGIAMRFALVGRLVLTTLHTNSISGALTRLLDMGVSKSIIASAFTGIAAQRLVRKICPSCRVESTPPYDLMKMFDIEWPADQKLYAGQGCNECGGSGFRDRIGLFEILEIDDDFRNIILQGLPISALEEYVKNHVKETLLQNGFDMVRSGQTTLEEVIRATI